RGLGHAWVDRLQRRGRCRLPRREGMDRRRRRLARREAYGRGRGAAGGPRCGAAPGDVGARPQLIREGVMERTYTVDELLGAVRRRWKWMAIVAGTVFALAAIVIAKLPNEYRARALAMVEPLQPHPDLVVPVISTTLGEKVKNVRSQVYARQLMSTVIDELNLYPKERQKDGMDAGVEALRLDTEVHAEGDDAF